MLLLDEYNFDVLPFKEITIKEDIITKSNKLRKEKKLQNNTTNNNAESINLSKQSLYLNV